MQLNRSIDLYERSFEQEVESQEKGNAGYVNKHSSEHGGGKGPGEGGDGGHTRARPTTAVSKGKPLLGGESRAGGVGEEGQRDSYIRTYMQIRNDDWRASAGAVGSSQSEHRAIENNGREDAERDTPALCASPVREQIAYHMLFPTGTPHPAESSSTRQGEEERGEEEEAMIARVSRVLGFTGT